MIKKSLICFAICFFLHLFLILKVPKLGATTHQWQEVVCRAQNYIYNSEKNDTVMVGTSLSFRIIKDSIPSVKSLSFGGCSVEDGLRIILQKSEIPKYILVETNLLFKDPSTDLFTNVTEGFLPIIRKWIPSLREQYSPICVYYSLSDYFIYSILKVNGTSNTKPQSKKKTSKRKSQINSKKFHEDLKRQQQQNDICIEEEILDRRVREIKTLFKELESRGAHLVFFEMPVNGTLVHLKKNEQIRKRVRQEFPSEKYLYLPNDSSEYLTSDGIHLGIDEAERYSHFMKKTLKNQKSLIVQE